jgi:hypothetical protein
LVAVASQVLTVSSLASVMPDMVVGQRYKSKGELSTAK